MIPYTQFDRNEALACSTTDPIAFKFRAMMRKAVMVVDQADYDKETTRRSKAGKPVTYADVAPSCRNYILPPEKLRPAIDAVVSYWVTRDLHIDMEEAVLRAAADLHGGANPKGLANLRTRLFDKQKFSNTYKRQMSHVCSKVVAKNGRHTYVDQNHVCNENCVGCMSDEASVDVNYQYPETSKRSGGRKPRKRSKWANKFYRARGSSQLENLHKFLRPLFRVAMGPRRAFAKMKRFFHEWNIDEGVTKRGDTDYGTYNHNLLAQTNSLARDVGAEKLPYSDLAFNTNIPDDARFGFDKVSPLFPTQEPSGLAGGGSSSATGSAASGSVPIPPDSAGSVSFNLSGMLAGAGLVVGLAMANACGAVGLVVTVCCGDGLCMIRACAADDPARPEAISRARVLESQDDDVVEYLVAVRKGTAQWLHHKWHGTGAFSGDGPMSAVDKKLNAQNTNPMYHVYTATGSLNVEATFQAWYTAMSGANTYEYGDNLWLLSYLIKNNIHGEQVKLRAVVSADRPPIQPHIKMFWTSISFHTNRRSALRIHVI